MFVSALGEEKLIGTSLLGEYQLFVFRAVLSALVRGTSFLFFVLVPYRSHIVWLRPAVAAAYRVYRVIQRFSHVQSSKAMLADRTALIHHRNISCHGVKPIIEKWYRNKRKDVRILHKKV